MFEIRKIETYAQWLDDLKDIHARARVLVRVERLAAGNPGDVRPVEDADIKTALRLARNL